MSELYGVTDDEESVRTINHALDLGISLLDTADSYGIDGHNERLVGRAVRERRGEAFIATKFGNVRDPDGTHRGVNARPEYVHEACDASLNRLGIETIDLYQLHRVDPGVPIEETVGAMTELVAAGKVRFIGLSEAMAEDIVRASSVASIATLQTEYSLFERHVESEIVSLCRELGIGFLAYAPLGRGLLTGRFKSTSDFTEGDYRVRSNHPRFGDESLENSSQLLAVVEGIAQSHGATTAQVALAWLLAQDDSIIPIPGTKRSSYLEQNSAAATLDLDARELGDLTNLLKPAGSIPGDRYPGGRTPTAVTPPLGAS